MTAEQALPVLRAEIAALEASGRPFVAAEWAVVVCSCTQAEGALVAITLGTRIAHGPGAFPCGVFLLQHLPPEVRGC